MKRKFIVLSIFICCSLELSAQTGQRQLVIDSLNKLLIIQIDDTEKVNILLRIAGLLVNNNPDMARDYGLRALELSHKLHFRRGEALATMSIATSLMNLGRFIEAMKYFEQGAAAGKNISDKYIISKAYDKMGSLCSNLGRNAEAMNNYAAALKLLDTIKDKREAADIYSNIGSTYEKMGRYGEAIKYQSMAFDIRRESGDREGIAECMNLMAMAYRRQGDYAEAMKSHLAALKIMEEENNKQGIAYAYWEMGVIYYLQNNIPESRKNSLAAFKIYSEIKNEQGIANSYGNIGIADFYEGKFKGALEYMSLALKMFIEIGDIQNMGIYYNNIGFFFKEQHNYKEAMKYLLLAVKTSEQAGDKSNIAETYESVGEAYYVGDKLNEAISWLNKAVSTANAINGKRIIKECYNALADVYNKRGDYRNAYKYRTLYTKLKEAIDEESSHKIADMKTSYETEKKDIEIKLLNKDKELLARGRELQVAEIKRQKFLRNGFLAGFAIILFFSVIVFVQRNHISKEKKRSDELLLNILPRETAEELRLTGTAKAKRYEMVTVLFTDFKNFTQATEIMSAEDLVKEIHFCYSEFDKIISGHGVEKIKTIGDSYMCAGGLPFKNTTNPCDVVSAALELQHFMHKINEQKVADGKLSFEIRIGIHTGPVIAGIVGINKFAYDIWGDTVNIASRMESSGEAGKVNISGNTFELVKDKFYCTYRGKILAKNKGEVDMYFVESKII